VNFIGPLPFAVYEMNQKHSEVVENISLFCCVTQEELHKDVGFFLVTGFYGVTRIGNNNEDDCRDSAGEKESGRRGG